MSAAKLLLRCGQKALWNPMDLGPNMVKAWWNADMHGNTSYMVDDGSGLISSWSSLVNKIPVTAATSARPTWTSGAWTASSPAKAGLTFDGSANCLVATSFAALPTGSTAGELWALVTQADSSVGGRQVVRYGSGLSTATNRNITKASAANNAATSDGVTTLSDNNNFFGAHIVGTSFSGTTEAGRYDGADFAPTASATIASLNTSTTRIRIGATNATSAANFWQGVIRHVIVTTLLSTAQRLLMEGWFAWDGWSSAAANPLPTTHPYKYRAP